MSLLIEFGWKSALCAGMTLLVLALMRSRSAAQKSLVAHLGLATLLLLPLGSALLPRIEVAAPAILASSPAPAPVDTSAVGRADVSPVPAIEEAPALALGDALLLGYAVPAALLLLLTLAAIGRLQLLRLRSEVVVDPVWLSALAAAQHRLGLKHGTALLTNSELRSPVSWGIVRPIIIIDAAAAHSSGRAEAIIAHELAHVARLDWLALMLGRLVTALFWFNPLVWLLARTSHELCEQAADDAVLRSRVPSADYADILVEAARHSTPPLLLAANGVAPGKSSLARRVVRVLDPDRNRMPVRLGWFALCAAAATGVGAATAAVQPHAVEAQARGDTGRAAAAELARIGIPQTDAIARAMETQDWEERRSPGNTRFNEPRAVKPLVDALSDKSPVTRRLAVWGLSEMRPAAAEAPVAGLLGDESPEVRAEAARALGDLGATGRSAEVARLLRDPSPLVRRQAAHALGDLQDPSTRASLEAALSDPEPAVRAKAAWALKQVREAETILQRFAGD